MVKVVAALPVPLQHRRRKRRPAGSEIVGHAVGGTQCGAVGALFEVLKRYAAKGERRKGRWGVCLEYKVRRAPQIHVCLRGENDIWATP